METEASKAKTAAARIREWVELVFLIGFGAVSVYVTLRGYFSWLPGPSATGSGIALLTLGILGILVIYLGLERRTTLDKIRRLSEAIEAEVLALQGGPLLELKDPEEVFNYVRWRISKANSRVDDLTWGRYRSRSGDATYQTAYEGYLSAKRAIAEEKRKSVTHREVMTFGTKEDRLLHVEDLLGESCGNYELRYYPIPYEDIPPLLSFIVIDDEEVILAFYRGDYIGPGREMHLAIRNPRIVRLFQDYYSAIWSKARIFKEIERAADPRELREIADSLVPWRPPTPMKPVESRRDGLDTTQRGQHL